MKSFSFIFILFIISTFSLQSFSQNNVSFKKEPLKDGLKVVSFKIDGITGEQHRAELRDALDQNDSINYVIIYPTDKCYMKITKGTDANYVQEILAVNGVDFNYETVDVHTESSVEINIVPIPKDLEEKNLPDDFPKYIDTGNPYEDEKRLAEEFELWRQNNPEEWQKMLEERENKKNVE